MSMNCFARIFLVWTMVLAIPLQGWAASQQSFCMTEHERMTVSSSSAEAASGSVEVSGLEHGSSIAAHEHSSLSFEGTCSVCALCCFPVAMLLEFAAPVASLAGYSIPPTPLEIAASHLPDLPDPPPRSGLA